MNSLKQLLFVFLEGQLVLFCSFFFWGENISESRDGWSSCLCSLQGLSFTELTGPPPSSKNMISIISNTRTHLAGILEPVMASCNPSVYH